MDLGIAGRRAAVAAATAGLGYASAAAWARFSSEPQIVTCAPSAANAAALDRSLLSVVRMCLAAVPAMRAAGWGRIVAITSLGVRQPYPDLVLSTTARAGATGFLRTLAREVAADGVTVNSVQPGYHATARARATMGEHPDLSDVPANRMGEAADFGAVVAFLCSNQANFLTGAAIPVDGGAYQALL